MNEKLKFSWGHIIAFIAILAVSYVSFTGLTYLTDGDFIFAIIGMAVLDLVFIGVFIGAQMLKASGTQMRRKIKYERALILISPAIFVAAMIIMAHFFTVHKQEKQIRTQFNNSIENARRMFDDYETYSAERMAKYNDMLSKAIGGNAGKKSLQNYGLRSDNVEIQKTNMEEVLRIQLLSSNYEALKASAINWINDAQNGATTWNVFILGNTKEIKKSIQGWEKRLNELSAKKMSNEEIDGEVETFSSQNASMAVKGLDSLNSTFTTMKFPTIGAIMFGIIIYLMLILPYFIQRRHTKSIYRNIFSLKKREPGLNFDISDENINRNSGIEKKQEKNIDDGVFRM